MAAGKDVPPAEAEDSDSSEEKEEEEEDDDDNEVQNEEESEYEKEDDKEDDDDDAFWTAEQFTVAVKYFPKLLQVLHGQPMTTWVTLSKTLSQLAATPNSLTDLLSEVVGEDDTNQEPRDSFTVLRAAPGAHEEQFRVTVAEEDEDWITLLLLGKAKHCHMHPTSMLKSPTISATIGTTIGATITAPSFAPSSVPSSVPAECPDVPDVIAGNEAWYLAAEKTFKVLPSRKEKMYFIFSCTIHRVKVHCESSGRTSLKHYGVRWWPFQNGRRQLKPWCWTRKRRARRGRGVTVGEHMAMTVCEPIGVTLGVTISATNSGVTTDKNKLAWLA